MDEEAICERTVVCWQCGKTVNGKVILHKETDLSHLVFECPRDGRIESILCKGRPSYLDTGARDIPSYWPHLTSQPDQKWDDLNVVNRENIPVLVFVTTSKCNSSCKICGVPELKNVAALADKNFFKEKLAFYKNRNKEVILCGGEPTTREDLPELITMVRESGNLPAIQTNGLKLADRSYVKKLKLSGLRHVRFSFDGLDKATYERVRGGKHELALKMKALTNLIEEDFKIALACVAMKGINENMIKEVIGYARRTRNIVEISFLPFSLSWVAAKNGFSAENLMSEDEVKRLIADAADITTEDFQLWDELKINIAFYIAKLRASLPFLPPLVFRNGIVYLKRTNNGMKPLLCKDKLRKLVDMVRNKQNVKLTFSLLPIIARMLFRNCLIPSVREGLFYYKENVFKIIVVSPLTSSIFRTTSLATFGFFDQNIGSCNSIHQR